MKTFVIGLVSILLIYSSVSLSWAIAAMEIPRIPLKGSPASAGLAYVDISFISRDDGVELKGWFIDSDGDSVVVFVNGGYQNRVDSSVDTLSLARDMVEEGYDLLLFDLRGRGESGGEGYSLSDIELDIGGAVDYLNIQGYASKNIGIMGFSSGAAAACIFASQETVGALILVGCFSTVQNLVLTGAASQGLPEFVFDFFIPGVLVMAKTVYGYELVNPVDVIPKIDCPILFIHEEKDRFVPSEEVYRLFTLSVNPNSQFWEVVNANHSQAYKINSLAFVKRVSGFLMPD
jgi:pimeloyl-ACP methyl ester carboxylesterase